MVSQVLVAYTIEVDNLFDVRMEKAGFSEYGLSLVSWSNFMQYVGGDDVVVQEIMDRTFATQSQVAQIAGTLERWFVVEVDAAKHRGKQRLGWLTSKGITAKCVITPTPQGRVAIKEWPRVLAQVEKRWTTRLGDALPSLRSALAAVVAGADVAMPDGVPSGWLRGDWRQFPPGVAALPADAPLSTLLSRALLAFTVAFERGSKSPLALSANTVRVLTDKGVPLSQVAVLSGLPSQMSSVQCTEAANAKLAVVAPDPATKRKMVRLTKAGAAAQRDYVDRLAAIEADMGRDAKQLRKALDAVFAATEGGCASIVEGLRPPRGVRRAGAPRPPLGLSSEMNRRAAAPRRSGVENAYVGAGQEARNKELVVQTESFISDPRGTLPHYPVWDQNRGFGP
jgi:hypothetical protein